jgi:hypothetical protein
VQLYAPHARVRHNYFMLLAGTGMSELKMSD